MAAHSFAPNFNAYPLGFYPQYPQYQQYQQYQQYPQYNLFPAFTYPAHKMIHAIMKNPEFFIDACRQLFATIVGIGQHLINSEHDKQYVHLYLRHSDVIDVQDGDKTYSFKFHVLLYGIQLSQDFQQRVNIFREIGIDNPFAAAQVYFRTKGLFLANHSNPAFGSNLVLKLFRQIPPNVGQLWHGQNRIPYVKDDIAMEDPRCVNVKHFYIEANKAYQHMLSNRDSIVDLIAERFKADAVVTASE